ncbi:MAG: glycosyl hydrolase [Bacteroidetes bacterium]|nr:glycosyl hydrolase [Bacteroidota bacterium]
MKALNIKFLVCILAILFILPENQAQRNKKNKREDIQSNNPLKNVSLSTFKFRSIGPALTSGRISDLAVNPDNPSEFYVAAAAGGVWKTTNGGVTFKPVFDSQGSYSIGCLAMDPNNHNVIWVGTGENNNQRSVSYGDGLYKSIDGGSSFTNVGLEESEHIGMIAIDPRDSDVVYVAAYGPVWCAGGDRGIYKTIDGGKNWEKILDISENTGFNEIHMDPRDADVLYATAHQRRRRQWTYLGGGPESGIYKSTDAGANWVKINNGLPSGDKGRIGMDISPANPEIIYAVVEAKQGKSGFFKSTNRGASWEKMSNTVTSGNYYQEVIADPVNPDRVYIMDTFTLLSNDGGKTFTNRGEKSKHWDNHALWIDPSNPLHTLEGGDGGLYESFDDGQNWRFFTNLPITQFYKVHVDNAFPFYNVMGGTQDNYSLLGPSQTLSAHGILTSDWIVTSTGDGFESGADPIDPNIVYTQSQYGNLQRFDKKSGESLSIQPIPEKGEDHYNFNWDAPLVISPHDNKTLYFAANKLFKSTDRGDSWEVISGELDQNIDRNLLPVMGKIWSMDAIAKNGSTSRYGSCVSLDESRLKEGLIYAGTDDGQINITEDGGASWSQVNTFLTVPENTYVYDLVADKHDMRTVYAAFNNHKSGDFKPYILKSTDMGKNWKNISSDLPEKGAVYALEQDHVNANILFAGTEYGVFVTLDGGESWKTLKTGIPTANVRDMMIQERENDLVVATFGRGFYILDNYSPLRELSDETLKKDGYVFAVKDAFMFNTWRPLGHLGSREKGFQGEDFFSAPNPDRGAVFTYWVRDSVSSLKLEREKREKKAFKEGENIPYPSYEEYQAEQNEFPSYLLFTITDEDGNFVRELRSSIQKGLNKIVWDMQHPGNDPVNDGDAKQHEGLPSSGVFVLPGKYLVSLAKNVKGEITELAGPHSFEIRELNNRTLPAADRKELVAFKQKAVKLVNAVGAVSRTIRELNSKIDPYKAATKAFTGNKAIQLLTEVITLENQLKAVQLKINGDRTFGRLDLDGPFALRQRSQSAIYDIYGSTSNIPGSSKRNYEIAADEFSPILDEVKQLVHAFEMMDDRLGGMNAPVTSGRLPNWKK